MCRDKRSMLYSQNLRRIDSMERVERNCLVEQYLPLVQHIANRIQRTDVDSDDLFQAGCLGLLHAADHFKSDKGCKFGSYAYSCIHGYMLHHIRRGCSVIRPHRSGKRHRVTSLELSDGTHREIADPAQSEDLNVAVFQDGLRDALRQAMDCLTGKERLTAELYYLQNVAAPSIAKTMGITRQRVYQTLGAARIKLREALLVSYR